MFIEAKFILNIQQTWPQDSITLPDQTKERRRKTDTQTPQPKAELNLED